jgi:hypothetical protein
MSVVSIRRFVHRLGLAAGLLAGGLVFPAAAQTPTATKTATVAATDPVHRVLSVATGEIFVVDGDGADAKLATLVKGDTVQFALAGDKVTASTILKANPIVDVGWLVRLFAGLAIAGLVVLIAHVVAKLSTGQGVTKYFIGKDNRVSNSQTQLALWGAMVFVVYSTTVVLRLCYGFDHVPDTVGGVDIPTNLLALSGLSALTFGGARAVTVSKDAAAQVANAAAPAAPVPQKQMSQQGPSLLDLFRNDAHEVDLGDTQMILITIVAIVIYSLKSFFFLGHIELSPSVTLPDVDTTLLAGFGVGQGAYLAKKAASNPGQG